MQNLDIEVYWQFQGCLSAANELQLISAVKLPRNSSVVLVRSDSGGWCFGLVTKLILRMCYY